MPRLWASQRTCLDGGAVILKAPKLPLHLGEEEVQSVAPARQQAPPKSPCQQILKENLDKSSEKDLSKSNIQDKEALEAPKRKSMTGKRNRRPVLRLGATSQKGRKASAPRCASQPRLDSRLCRTSSAKFATVGCKAIRMERVRASNSRSRAPCQPESKAQSPWL